MNKLSIILPAYNEEQRIGNTLEQYSSFFSVLEQEGKLAYELVVALNGCKDNTLGVVKNAAAKHPNIRILNLHKSGKGFAIIEGFKDALQRSNNLIGFVDADCATKPDAFYDLVCKIGHHDGIIASRYLPGAIVHPREKLTKVLGSRFFNLIIRLLFFMPFKDTQCGAKLFKAQPLSVVLPDMQSTQWAFDVDLLYGFKRHGFKVIEVPTVWADQKLSKLSIFSGGMGMLANVIKLRLLYSPLRTFFKKS